MDKIVLSSRDRSVLGAIFDPEASLQNTLPVYTAAREPYDNLTLERIREQERSAILLINEDRPDVAKVEQAVKQLDNIITTFPKYASAWNNRAQATRVLCEVSNTSISHVQANAMYEDLSRAIELAQPEGPSGGVPASSKEVLASAYTHRGLLLLHTSRAVEAGQRPVLTRQVGVSSTEELEEMASKDFCLGGKHGNRVAQQLAVKTNPYAKLCGSIVREAITKEIEDFRQQTL